MQTVSSSRTVKFFHELFGFLTHCPHPKTQQIQDCTVDDRYHHRCIHHLWTRYYAIIMGISEDGLEKVIEDYIEEGMYPITVGGDVILHEYVEDHNLHLNCRIFPTSKSGEKINMRVAGIIESNDMTDMLTSMNDICVVIGTLDLYEKMFRDNYGLYDSCILIVDDSLGLFDSGSPVFCQKLRPFLYGGCPESL